MELYPLLLIAFAAGLAMPVGALVAVVPAFGPNWLVQEWRHGILALGAGALVSAVSLVLVPHGISHVGMVAAITCFIAGAVAFMLLDIALAKTNTPRSQLAAMLADFLPESLAMGATAALGGNFLLIGILIAVQNFPEGFNAYREIEDTSQQSGDAVQHRKWQTIASFFAMATLGPACCAVGYFLLFQYPSVMGGLMLFASGGILYTVFQDIAPQIKLDKHWAPPMGAILGFLIGVIGLMLS